MLNEIQKTVPYKLINEHLADFLVKIGILRRSCNDFTDKKPTFYDTLCSNFTDKKPTFYDR
jgi:hypothetical protein